MLRCIYSLHRPYCSYSFRPLKKNERMSKFFTSTISSVSNSPFSSQTCSEELTARAAVVTAQQQKELLKYVKNSEYFF